ncbi:MAG: 1-deoxy-D-xylulose-5-phosphate synthase, partial [FCB group bacterium]|nr:1-deoxy-D-xylulose-5-phosphate synthase [FCB group bacterium]
MDSNTSYALLESIASPADLKHLSLSELTRLADELRNYIIEVVSETGGHLAPSLGTVELTVALLHVFDLPDDKVIWDVGHQAYAFKVLTGRREQLKGIRQYGGISGFPKRSES